jgi:hypothetical protein
MVRVLAADRLQLHFPGLDHLAPVSLAEYFLDRYEVTNRQFKVFIDSGGYRRREFWQEPFEDGSRWLPWDQAVARFGPGDTTVAPASRPIARPDREFARGHPVSDAVFAIYRRLYAYGCGNACRTTAPTGASA